MADKESISKALAKLKDLEAFDRASIPENAPELQAARAEVESARLQLQGAISRADSYSAAGRLLMAERDQAESQIQAAAGTSPDELAAAFRRLAAAREAVQRAAEWKSVADEGAEVARRRAIAATESYRAAVRHAYELEREPHLTRLSWLSDWERDKIAKEKGDLETLERRWQPLLLSAGAI